MENEIKVQVKALAKEAMRETYAYCLGAAAKDYLETQRKIMYTLYLEKEGIALQPVRTKLPFKGDIVILSANEWDDYEAEFQAVLGNLEETYRIIDKLQDTAEKYHKMVDFDNYLKVNKLSCDINDFERVRERFQKTYDEDLGEDEIEF